MKTLIVVPTAKISAVPEWMHSFDRNYDVLHVNYSDEVMQEHTTNRSYMVVNYKGQKWSIIKQLLRDRIDLLSGYDYIGFWDDDLEASVEDVNNSIVVAAAMSAKMWQISLTQDSDCFYPVLRKNIAVRLYRTNFIEIMAPFYHRSLLMRMKEFFDMYDVSTGWGFDLVGSALFETYPLVIHSYSIRHPHREVKNTYDQIAAFDEQVVCLQKFHNLKQQYGLNEPSHNIKVINAF